LTAGAGVFAITFAAAAQETAEPPAFGEIVEVRTGFVRFLLPADAPPPTAADLEVRWKKQPQRIVRVVGGAGDPLELGILVDRTTSFQHAFEPLRAAALEVAGRALTEHDRLFAVAFSDHSTLLAEGRGDAARVLATLPAGPEPGTHPTAFYDAIDRALGRFQNADARAALVVVSDGCDLAGDLARAPNVARRARELAIPVFLLLPDRDDCRYSRCSTDANGRWHCVDDSAPTIYRGSASDFNNPASRPVTMAQLGKENSATAERERFSGRISKDGGGAFVVHEPEEWQAALERIFERLSRQWTVVFEPSSEAVSSDEVEVFGRNARGRRRKLR
jgi:hypothetical protein